MSTPSRGRIVWVELPDPQGRNSKRRPAMILTATEDIALDGTVVVVGISSQLSQAPTEVQVELPWHNQGHPRTGLKERCAAVCNWLIEVPVSAIQGYAGMVPGAHLLRIVTLVEDLQSPPPEEEADTAS